MGTSTALAGVGMALGQGDYSTPSDASTTTYSSSPSTPASSALSAPRTGLYMSVTKGNGAADNTVDDFSRRPTLIGDKQYFAGYGGADMQNAAFSLRLGDLNWFGQVTAGAAPSPATLRFGAASGTSWGGGVLLAVNREYDKPAAAGSEVTTYYDPSGFGLFGDVSLGNSDLYGSVSYNTGLALVPGVENSVHTDPPVGPEDDDKNRTVGLMVGWKKDATTEGTHSWNVEGNYMMSMQDLENPDVDNTFSQIAILPAWGYIFRSTTDYAVFLGVNALDQYTIPDDGFVNILSFSPNIALHKQLGKGIEGFSGFSVTGTWAVSRDVGVDGSESSDLLTGGADVAVGLRWVKDNFALEGSLKETVLSNGPYLIGGNAGQGFFFDIGISLGI